MESEDIELSLNGIREVSADALSADLTIIASWLRRRYPMASEAVIQSSSEDYKELYTYAHALAEDVYKEKISRVSMLKTLSLRWPSLSEEALRSLLVKALSSRQL